MEKNYTESSPKAPPKKQHEGKKGHLKIYIGYAPGVGKTYSMLNEANKKTQQGHEILIGYLETHKREETQAQIGVLEIIPRKKINYNGKDIEEMDIDAIIERHPETVLIDELAHTNVPGSKNTKRYEDVAEILRHGINVISTVNIQHLESLNDTIYQITGIKVRETVPDKIVEDADEVVVVDITPEALQSRLKRGAVYKPETAARALKNFFRKGNLNALREIALRVTAEEVDEDLEEYMKQTGKIENLQKIEKVLICISSNPSAKKLIRRGARVAKRFKCEWIVVSVNSTRLFVPKPTEKDLAMLESHYKLASQLGAEVVKLTGKNISKTIAKFAFKRNITQLIIGHSKRTSWQSILRGSAISKLLKYTKNISVHVIPND